MTNSLGLSIEGAGREQSKFKRADLPTTTTDSTVATPQIEQDSSNREFVRQNSLASYSNLSLSADAMSDNSGISAPGPCTNQPFIADDATEEEKAIHAFLDKCDIYQINVKNQIDAEKK